MTTTQSLHIVKIEDHEGDGRCSECNREGLRWICTLSDGTTVGTECARKIVGFKPAPKSYNWAAGFTATAKRAEGNTTFVLWRNGNRVAVTRNAILVAVGGSQTGAKFGF